MEPSGQWHSYYGTAVGKGRQAAKTEIERLQLGGLTCREGLLELCKILHRVHDDEKPYELELAWVCEESGRQFQVVPADVATEAIRAAKAAIEEADMED